MLYTPIIWITNDIQQNLANFSVNVTFAECKIIQRTENLLDRSTKKWQMTPTVTLHEILVFLPREQLKGIAETVEVVPYTAMSLLWITLLLDMWVDIYLSACSRACLFVCAVQCVSLINRLISSSSSQQNNVCCSLGRLRQICSLEESCVLLFHRSVIFFLFFGRGKDEVGESI